MAINNKVNFAEKGDPKAKERLERVAEFIARARRDEFKARFGDSPSYGFVPKKVRKTHVVEEALKEKIEKKTDVEKLPVMNMVLLGHHLPGRLIDAGIKAITKIYTGRVASDEGYFIRRKK